MSEFLDSVFFLSSPCTLSPGGLLQFDLLILVSDPQMVRHQSRNDRSEYSRRARLFLFKLDRRNWQIPRLGRADPHYHRSGTQTQRCTHAERVGGAVGRSGWWRRRRGDVGGGGEAEKEGCGRRIRRFFSLVGRWGGAIVVVNVELEVRASSSFRGQLRPHTAVPPVSRYRAALARH